MHAAYTRQGAHYTSYSYVIVDSLDDDFREPCSVPRAEDEGSDELVVSGGRHLVLAAWLSKCALGRGGGGGGRRGGEGDGEGGGGGGEERGESGGM